MNTKYFISFLGLILLMSCKHEYYYLSGSDKNYLFYDVGDKLMFIKRTDTIYGEVSSKEFFITSTGIFGTDHFEVGTLHIKNMFDSVYWIANINLINSYGEVNYDIDIAPHGLYSLVDSCIAPIIYFRAKIKGSKLYECKYDTCSNMNMVPIKSDIYEFNSVHEFCPGEKKSILQLSKSQGLTFFILDNAKDTILIKGF